MSDAKPSRILQALARLLDASYCDSPPDAHQVDSWREAAHLARQEYDALMAQVRVAARLAEALREVLPFAEYVADPLPVARDALEAFDAATKERG